MISANLDVRMFSDHAVTGQELQLHIMRTTLVNYILCADGFHSSGGVGWGVGHYLSHQQLQQRGLPRSVGTHQSHACIQVDTKLQVFINVRLAGAGERGGHG